MASGMGVKGVGLDGISEPFGNPASMHFGDEFTFYCSFQRKFELKEFDNILVAIAYPRESWNYQLAASSFGAELYSETRFIASVAKMFKSRYSLASSFGYLGTNVKNYSSKSGYHIDLATQIRFGQIIQGITVQNALANGGDKIEIPTVLNYGISTELSDRILVIAEIHLQEFFQPEWAIGLQARLFEKMEIRGGYTFARNTVHIGLSLYPSSFVLSSAMIHHPFLGWTRGAEARWSQQ